VALAPLSGPSTYYNSEHGIPFSTNPLCDIPSNLLDSDGFRVEHRAGLSLKFSISIEPTCLWNSTRFDRAVSIRLELDMLDSKSIFRSKYQNYKTFNNITFYDSRYAHPVLRRSIDWQVSNPVLQGLRVCHFRWRLRIIIYDEDGADSGLRLLV
jgi:hypothetical protein